MRFIGIDGIERQSREVFWVTAELAYDLDRAREILIRDPREPEWVELDLARAFIASGRVGIDPERLERVDVDEPGIGVITEDGVILLDGWHRAARRLQLMECEMPVHLLSVDELVEVRGHVPVNEARDRPEWQRQRPLS